ncbi:MAG: ABC transporter permease [Anaerolineae bacterium]|nr:ABC transporter permease [Anaerolineae bacterium]
MAPTFVIARLTFREAARRKILLAALLLGLVFLALYGTGLYFTHQDFARSGELRNPLISNPIFNFLLLAGLYVVNFLFAVMTVLTSVDTVAGEIASGTVHAIAAKPVRRWEILLGKWLGFVVMMTLYLVLMAGGVTTLSRTLTGYVAPHMLRGLSLIWLNGMVLLNLSLLGGVYLSTLANGVVAFAAYGIAFLGGWLEQIGSLLHSTTAVNVGIVSSLLMPGEALWKRAAFEMRSPVVDVIGFSPFTSGSSVPSPLMIVYAIAYAMLALGLALWGFSRRDL